METAKCKYCGAEFSKKHSSQKFCCEQCRNKYWNKKRSKNRRSRKTSNSCIRMPYLEYLFLKKEALEDLMSDDNF